MAKPTYSTLRLGEHTRSQYSEDTGSYTAQLNFNTMHFSASFVIDNGTFAADNLQVRLHQWGTDSGCQGMCPGGVPQLAYATDSKPV